VGAESSSGKDLKPLFDLPRSPSGSYLRKALAERAPYHYSLVALLPSALVQWACEYFGHRLGPKHRFPVYEGTDHDGIYPLGDDSVIGGDPDPGGEVRISVAGDWGAGTDEAAEVARHMMRSRPHYTIHLGDVYYVGNGAEVRENCLGVAGPHHRFTPVVWPTGSVGTFALNGNHEMYALGRGYFDVFLPALGMRPAPGAAPAGQRASFFCLRNEHWILVALDTGYNSIGLPLLELAYPPDSHLPAPLVRWVREQVTPLVGGRGVILLSHHQYYSVFDKQYPAPAVQLRDVFARPVLWLWGHEHRMAIYGKYQTGGGVLAYGRCIGHGGMPVARSAENGLPTWPMVLYDNRRYPNTEDIVVGYNGFATLAFAGDRLTIEYRDLTGTLVLEEGWTTKDGNVIGTYIRVRAEDPDIKYDPPLLTRAIT
jgi:hypothetical protein